MLKNAITTISEKDAMDVGSKSWREGIEYKTTNTAYGLRTAGLWTFYFPDMQRRLNLFK